MHQCQVCGTYYEDIVLMEIEADRRSKPHQEEVTEPMQPKDLLESLEKGDRTKEFIATPAAVGLADSQAGLNQRAAAHANAFPGFIGSFVAPQISPTSFMGHSDANGTRLRFSNPFDLPDLKEGITWRSGQ